MSKNNIGLSVGEGVANGLVAFQEPAKRNIGLLMERERGIENTPVRFTSLSEDLLKFGDYVTTSYGQVIVRNLIKNAKNAPVVIYGVRVLPATGCSAATVTATISGVSVVFTAAQRGVQDKGTWGNNLSAIFYSYDYKVRNQFYIEVYYKGVLVETFQGATCAALQVAMNNGSDYMMVSFPSEVALPVDTTGTGTVTCTVASPNVAGVGTAFDTQLKVGSILKNAAGTTVGVVKTITNATALILEENAKVAITAAAFKFYLRFGQTATLASGTYASPTESDFYPTVDPLNPKGISSFNGANVQIIASTEFHSLTMATVGRDYCEARKDCIFVGNLPLNANEATLQSYASGLQQNSTSFIATYNAWVKTSDGTGGYITVPALGCILGAAYLRVPFLQGDFTHIPPAGMDSAFIDVVDVYPGKISQAQLDQYTRDYTINSVVYLERIGWIVMTSRTMSTNSLYASIHIRMLTSFYRRVLLENMGWVIQRPNTPELKKEVYAALYAYFKGEYRSGALERSVPFEEACIIVCDQTNNPLGGDRKQLNADVNWIPTEATEAFKTSLNRNDGILTVTS